MKTSIIPTYKVKVSFEWNYAGQEIQKITKEALVTTTETNPDLIASLHDMTKNPYMNPAFERAVSRAGGVETSSSPGNKHFSFGNKDG